MAINDAGRFLDEHGTTLETFAWTPEELFATATPDGRMGVVWWLGGRTASAVGHDNVMCSGPVYDRTTSKDWVGYRLRPLYSPAVESQLKTIHRVFGR
jgi:hypothetical protein